MKNLILSFLLISFSSWANESPFADSTRNYLLPTFTKNNQGEAILYWTEKDNKNTMYLYFSVSKDGGSTFSDKKLIYADANLGASKLARPKLLFKKDGTMLAIFTYRINAPMPAAQKPAQEMGHGEHSNHDKPAATPIPPQKRSSQIRYTESKDNGTTWSELKSVDTDTTPLTRGFFDAVVLANDEIAVAYLKDVKGSTKHEERDLRLAITKNGIFQDEKLIDPVVCDCCNISLLVDSKGALNIFYRDNNDDVRDIARMTSSDNGATFSEPKIIHNDKWEIKGCPHSGAVSVASQNDQYVAWFSGTENEQAGIRLVNSSGKLLKILDAMAKNAGLAADTKNGILVWEQAKNGISNIFYSKIQGEKVTDGQEIAKSEGGQNASTLLINGKAMIAYEIKQTNQSTTIGTKVITL